MSPPRLTRSGQRRQRRRRWWPFVSSQAVEIPGSRESRLGVTLGAEAAPTLIHWSTCFMPERVGPFDSYALRTRDGWVVIDPLEPDAAVLERLERLMGERPSAIVLTS